MGEHLTRAEFNLWTLTLLGVVVVVFGQWWFWPEPWASVKSFVFELAGKIGGG